MKCACPCKQEFEPKRSNQIYLSGAHRQKDKDRRWPRKRRAILPVALRNASGEHQEAETSGVPPLAGTKSLPGGSEAVRREVEAHLARLGLLARVEFEDFLLDGPELLTPSEVARFLRVSRDTLFAWERGHHGPPCIKLSRCSVRFLRRGLGCWLRARIEGRKGG